MAVAAAPMPIGRLTTELWEKHDILETAPAPPGYEVHVVITGPDQTLTVLPAAPRAAAAGSILRWTDATPPSELAIRAAGWFGLRTGLAAPLLRSRVSIRTERESEAGPSLHSYLSDALGKSRISVCCEFGSPRPNQKPVIRVSNADGRPLAFGKVGWNPLTTALIDHEARFLAAPATKVLRSIRVPEVLHDGVWRNRRIVLLSPVLGNLTLRRPPAPSLAVLNDVANLSPQRVAPVSSSRYWESLQRRVASLRYPHVAEEALERIGVRWGVTPLPWGHWHGDWTPWNMRTHRDELIVWDWERTGEGVPVGFDPLHYEFHTALASGNFAAVDALQRSVIASAETMQSLGVPAGAEDAVGTLYALEMHLRFAPRGSGQQTTPPPRWLNGLLSGAVRRLAGT